MINSTVTGLTALPESQKQDGLFVFGSIVGNEEKKNSKKESDNPFEKKPLLLHQPFVQHRNRITFRQSRELLQFLATDNEERKQQRNIAEGELLHLVMSWIERKEDVSAAIERVTIEGLISSEKQFNNIKRLIDNAIANPMAADWFDGTYKLYNECSILTKDDDKKSRRPDRVMIKDKEAVVVDYKFAKENEEYKKQVRKYMSLLTEMGYSKVKGYLWYVYKNKIETVEL